MVLFLLNILNIFNSTNGPARVPEDDLKKSSPEV